MVTDKIEVADSYSEGWEVNSWCEMQYLVGYSGDKGET